MPPFKSNFEFRYIDPHNATDVIECLLNNNIIKSTGLYTNTADEKRAHYLQIKCRICYSPLCYYLTNDERRRILRILKAEKT
jgi:hypothetical protein